MKNIMVILLAAGDATRFWPISGKYNLYFLGKSLPDYQLEQLQRFGLTDIIIVVNEQNISFFTSLKSKFPQLNMAIVKQTIESGMAGAVLSAKKYIQGKSILVLNQSDLFEDLIFDELLGMLKLDNDGIMAGTMTDSDFPGGYLTLENDKVMELVEKPGINGKPSNIVKFVCDYFRTADSFIQEIERLKTSSDDRYEQALDALIKKGLAFKFMPYKGYWGYLKYPWHILNLTDYFLRQIKGRQTEGASIDKSAKIIGNVVIDREAKIMEGAKIAGPAYIGKGSVVGNNALVRESIIGDRSVIGYKTEIVRSYIGANCWFHSNYIGDSVISDNVSLGAGTITANYKLDEDLIKSPIAGKMIDTGRIKLGTMIGSNVRIGVNSSLMPGIKIGKNSMVGASVMLNLDLPDDTFCSVGKLDYVMKKNKKAIYKMDRQNLLDKLISKKA